MNKDERVNLIIAYESSELDERDTLRLFQNLIDTGLAWSLQGHYGRTARMYIENNIIKKGEIR